MAHVLRICFNFRSECTMTSRRNFLTIAGAASLGLAPTFQIARAQ